MSSPNPPEAKNPRKGEFVVGYHLLKGKENDPLPLNLNIVPVN